MAEKASEIKFSIHLDENNIPEKIKWEASDANKLSACKAAFLTLWDEQEKQTLRIDLWTKDFLVDEMKQFFHQNLATMADTLERSTGEKEMAQELRDFSLHFARKLKLIE